MKAVTNDSEGKLSQAISFYIQALEYFIPALECELYKSHPKANQGCMFCFRQLKKTKQ